MKNINNSGFTLVELLAVIVILAIITVASYATLMPVLESGKKKSFATEANAALDAASNAIALLEVDELKMSELIGNDESLHLAKETENTYCITLTSLATNGLLKKQLKDSTGKTVMEGAVTAIKNGKTYTYRAVIKNEDYYVNTMGGTVSDESVQKLTDDVDVNFDCR